jgi:hypothetical protein
VLHVLEALARRERRGDRVELAVRVAGAAVDRDLAVAAGRELHLAGRGVERNRRAVQVADRIAERALDLGVRRVQVARGVDRIGRVERRRPR